MEEPPHIVQYEVAGTIITLDANREGALVLYADCQYRGKEVQVFWRRDELVGKIVERKTPDGSICAAIFPRLPLNYHISISSSAAGVVAEYPLKLSGEKDKVEVFRGNVSEGYLVGE